MPELLWFINQNCLVIFYLFQVIVIAALVAVALARPQPGHEAHIVRLENDNIGVDGYNFA